jgi:hypothetical protein
MLCLGLGLAPAAYAQGAAPESAPPLFPGGGLVSYNSVFSTRGEMLAAPGVVPPTSRPTFAYDGELNFTWGFRPNFDFELFVPVVDNHFENRGGTGQPVLGGVSFGDLLILLKCRFYRRDSKRGTTQASFNLGPKLPTGSTSLPGANGVRLPASLQSGSGSTDVALGASWTYTGLFGVRRLVADEDFHALVRTTGTQSTRLGSNLSSRLWLSYRPYESKNISHEWFIGPSFTVLDAGDDRIAGARAIGSGGAVLLAGVTTYAGLGPGTHAWLALDWDAAHSTGVSFVPERRLVGFGITHQFRLGMLRKESK